MANTIEIGADHNRLPGINRLVKGGFATANALRRLGRPTIARHDIGQSASVWSGAADFASGPVAWGKSSAWSQWIARAAHRGRIVANRRRNYLHLAALLADLPGARVLQPDLPDAAAPYVFPLWVAAPARSYQKVRNAGVPIFRWDDVWPDIPMTPGDGGADWAVHIYQLGCHQDLDLDDLAMMADTLREILAAAQS
jgi:hypothetical protein